MLPSSPTQETMFDLTSEGVDVEIRKNRTSNLDFGGVLFPPVRYFLFPI